MASKTLISKLFPLTSAAIHSQTLLRLRRPLIATSDFLLRRHLITATSSIAPRHYSSRPTQSSLNDPSPNWSNRPPKETILLEGCDFEHWLCVMEPPDANMTRDDIISHYIKTLAQVVGSEEEARMKIYSVSTKHYFAFGALISEELSYKMKEIPGVRWVLPDSYLDVRNKDYGGEPFINGEAVPYDPKYHEEWVRNNARANERSRRNDRPRNFDRSRNFERRSQQMQNQGPPPMPNQGFQTNPNPNGPPQNAGAPPLPNQGGPPMPNQGFQTNPNSNAPPQNAGAPPMQNFNFNRSPATPPPQNSPPPNAGYPNQAPNPSYQSGGGYQGGAPAYHQGPPGYQQGSAPAYQQGNPGYQQGGAPAYHQGNPGYQQGGAPSYQQGNTPAYQSGGNNYQPGYQNYQGGNSNPNPAGYQSAGNGYQGGNPGGYQGGASGYEPREVPGRDNN